MALRIGVASIVQETNTFSVARSTLDEFQSQGLLVGAEVLGLAGSNTEVGGAIVALRNAGAEPIALLKAWAMSGGILEATALAELGDILERELRRALPIDGLVLSLHGALVAEGADSGDLVLLRRARACLGEQTPIGVCLDLHAHPVDELVAEASFVIGYRTYPHVDQAETGARTAQILLDALEGRRSPRTVVARRAMLTPPEAQGDDGPFGRLRRRADALAAKTPGVVDISLFPVQPWLDVPAVGFAVTVTAEQGDSAAPALSELLADEAWAARAEFAVELVSPEDAIERARTARSRPVLLSESADSPTAGSTGDSPAMVRELLRHGAGLRAYVTLVDAAAADTCRQAGVGSEVALAVGSSIDTRFHEPVAVAGTVGATGEGRYVLTGPVFTGMEVSMGAWARIDSGTLSILVTERPACTFDPATFEHAGLDPDAADVVVVRSANLFRAGWGARSDGAIILDLPGASTPRLERLTFERASRPLYPLD
jgi:microcystin degradation protein MlrC